LIDASWSDTYAEYGAHFNRVAIDGLICGAVPIMRDWGDPTSPLEANIHYIPFPTTGPAAVARVVDQVCRDNWSSWLVRAREVLPLWDCKNVAATFLELAEGRGTTHGKKSAYFYARGRDEFNAYFGA
jgi:hypothetical protein